ncbi:phytanoyl-CoA dioxygenase family protein [Roseomonas sp. GC11]|uniref:phytanoyl-CoA dioxygenase family protein n=1 Tax=Roseomonas sp. GC11 TaxID=2950546 RepID=UPI00210D120F|nr:phytanoyl-CoA dioxygenase family protein [Roseomonas sp. GC11]MCQ4161687.1 phytanoyl-CoA dioxygenase family protein [Roseomonas sp. GC11]
MPAMQPPMPSAMEPTVKNPFSYGLDHRPRPEIPDPAEALAFEELARNGFTILPPALPGETLAAMRAALDGLVEQQAARFGDAAALARMGDAMTARALLCEAPIFLEILRLPHLQRMVEGVLGPAAIVLQQNGIVMPPARQGHRQHSWHRDLPYQEWVCSRPLALGSLLVLDDFSAESGGTLFLPGSQHVAEPPSRAFIERWQYQAVAPAGSIVVFDAMVLHRGGVNLGAVPRRAVNTLFGVPILAQQIQLHTEEALEPRLRRFLGADYARAPGVDAWRQAQLARLQARE